MKLKLDAAGNAVLQEVNGVKMPVYVHDDGKESPFDAAATVQSLSSRMAQNQRVEDENKTLKATLEKFKDIKDPAAALKALDTVKDLDLKKLVDAGELDRVKKEVSSVYDEKLAESAKTIEGLNDRLYKTIITNAFANSKVRDKLAVPMDLIQARFGEHFGVDADKVYATDAKGNRIYSKSSPGDLASFDEALLSLVEQHPDKDVLLRGAGASGSGSSNGGNGGGGQGGKSMSRASFDALNPVERSQRMREGFVITE